MPKVYDDWDRLVRATVRRKELWELCHAHSRTTSGGSTTSVDTPGLTSPIDEEVAAGVVGAPAIGARNFALTVGAVVRSQRAVTLAYFSDGRDDSNQLSGNSDADDLEDYDDDNVIVSYGSSIEGEEECVDLPFSDSSSYDEEEPAIFPERPMVVGGVKGMCHRCHKRHRFAEKEVCIVCNAKYCSNCVLRAMGPMPEGRKCVTCIGFRIYEPKRGQLGKFSRMLKRMLTDSEIKQIITAEISSEVNQLPPYLIRVNDKPLSLEELVMLQSCPSPPKKLRPGKYWYDKVSGLWGKDGEKPSELISPLLCLGYQIRANASNGDTGVLINNREITKLELRMLRLARVPCEGKPSFWVTDDGSYKYEGMTNVLGNLWKTKGVRAICAFFSLPYRSDTANPGDDEVGSNLRSLEKKMMDELLLVGGDQSGTSTIFKQIYNFYNICPTLCSRA